MRQRSNFSTAYILCIDFGASCSLFSTKKQLTSVQQMSKQSNKNVKGAYKGLIIKTNDKIV